MCRGSLVSMHKPAIRDAMLLLVRIVVGIICIIRGLDKLFFCGMDEIIGSYSAQAVPAPAVAAWVVMLLEVFLGAALVVGLLTTFVAGVLFIAAAVMQYFLGGIEFLGDQPSYEPMLMFFTLLLVIVVFGAGRASVDGVLARAES